MILIVFKCFININTLTNCRRLNQSVTPCEVTFSLAVKLTDLLNPFVVSCLGGENRELVIDFSGTWVRLLLAGKESSDVNTGLEAGWIFRMLAQLEELLM